MKERGLFLWEVFFYCKFFYFFVKFHIFVEYFSKRVIALYVVMDSIHFDLLSKVLYLKNNRAMFLVGRSFCSSDLHKGMMRYEQGERLDR